MALTPRRAKFVELYVTSLNATKAAEGAGFSKKTAYAAGSRLLKDVEVIQAIEAKQAALAKREGITLDRWLEEWATIGFSNVEHYDVDPAGGISLKRDAPGAAIRAVSAIKTKVFTDPEGGVHTETEFKLWSKERALENIGKHLGFYPREFNGEGAPNGRTPTTIRKDGEKTVIDWGDGLRIEL